MAKLLRYKQTNTGFQVVVVGTQKHMYIRVYVKHHRFPGSLHQPNSFKGIGQPWTIINVTLGAMQWD